MQNEHRSPETEASAELLRRYRRNQARCLRTLRQAAAKGSADAAKRLRELRRHPSPFPNPDRRSTCARCAERAYAVYSALRASRDYDAALLEVAARQTDLFATL